MPIYMDRHEIPGATAEKVAEAHQMDLKVQDKFKCKALTYWFDEKSGMAFCLVKAPDKQAVKNMHNRAHGLIPNEVIEVDERMVETFLGRISDPAEINDSDIHNTIINETGIRTLVHLSLKYPNGYFKNISSDRAFLETTDYHNLIDDELNRSGGQKIIMPGRGLMISFNEFSNSVKYCKKILNRIKAKKLKIKASAGLSTGFPVGGSKEFFGNTLKAVSRLSFAAIPGSIYISSSIRQISVNTSFKVMSPDSEVKTLLPEDEKFLNQLYDFTENYLNKDNCTIDQCCKKIGLSKSKLYRKTVSLTGLSPLDYIKEFRLKKAMEMMKIRKGNITEIAFDAGFNTPSYFSKCFNKRFGIQPSAYLNLAA